MGYPTIALPKLQNETDISLNLTEYEGSWWAGCLWLCGAAFAPLGGEVFLIKKDHLHTVWPSKNWKISIFTNQLLSSLDLNM